MTGESAVTSISERCTYWSIWSVLSLDSVDAVGLQLLGGVAQDPRRVQEVVDHDRAHRVEFEVALGPGERDGGVVAEDLDADHHHGFRIGWG